MFWDWLKTINSQGDDMNLQTLYTELKSHYLDYGYNGCGLGNSLDQLIVDLIDNGYSKSLVKKICLMAYYK